MKPAFCLRPEMLHSPLFDASWYRSRYPEVALSGIDPRRHYTTTGERNGYQPNPLFHTKWLRKHHQELADTRESPLAWFIAREGTDKPNPLFDPTWYCETHQSTAGASVCGLSQYLSNGVTLEVAPHPLFDSRWYREHFGHLLNKNEDPFAHYLRVGEVAGCNPNPLFDVDWYRAENLNAAAYGDGALAYYCDVGAAKNESPHPFVDLAWYRGQAPIVNRLGLDPLAHLLEATSKSAPTSPRPLNAYVETTMGSGAPDSSPNPHFRQTRQDLDFAASIVGEDQVEGHVLKHLLQTTRYNAAPDTKALGFRAVDNPTVSIIVPAFNQLFHTLACLRSLARVATEVSFEVILADDASAPRLTTLCAATFSNLRIVRNETNQGFIRTCNLAANEARGEYLVFLNNDTLATDHWLDELVATFSRFPDVGIAGSKLLLPNGRVAEAGGIVWGDASPWNFGRGRTINDPEVQYAREVDYISGASLMIAKRDFAALNGFDTAFAPAYFEDTDLAFRVRQLGKRVIYQPNSEVFHFEGVTSGIDIAAGAKKYQAVNQSTFTERWADAVQGHGIRGEAPVAEKDRYFSRRALVIDASLPSPARDARSLRLFNMMKILRDDGYKISFISENDAEPMAIARQLRGSGIELVEASSEEQIRDYLDTSGTDFDLCITARPNVAGRWSESLLATCPNATLVFDQTDLPLEGPTLLQPDESHRSLVRFEDRGDASHPSGAIQVSRIYEPPSQPVQHSGRSGIWLATGLRDDVTADAMLWLRDEVLPLLPEQDESKQSEARLYYRAEPWAQAVIGGIDWFRPLQATEFTAIDGSLFAIAPARFGPPLTDAIARMLSRGLPCIATSHAASDLPAHTNSALLIADTPKDFAAAIVSFSRDNALWLAHSQAALASSQTRYRYEEAKQAVLGAVP
jgi:GT2 family glycosyltransferase